MATQLKSVDVAVIGLGAAGGTDGVSHEIPNLGIPGASVMGTGGARNPTLTAQALAWRTADHLAKSWKSFQ
jgi:hypothetical protein